MLSIQPYLPVLPTLPHSIPPHTPQSVGLLRPICPCSPHLFILIPQFYSFNYGFCSHSAKKSILVKVTDMLNIANFNGNVCVLISLYLSAAFPTLNKSFFLFILLNIFGFTSQILLQFSSSWKKKQRIVRKSTPRFINL